MSTNQNPNMKIWNQVSETDPAFTKGFTKPSGFKGTSINATYATRVATEVFGPCGIGWGVTVEDEQIIDTNPIYNGNGQVIGSEKMHMVRINLWYELDGKRGNITHYGQTMLTFIGRNGVEVDEDAPKKSLTDATTKALSMLGFSADIFTGLYDDNKYVESVRDKFLAKANQANKVVDQSAAKAEETVNKAKEQAKATPAKAQAKPESQPKGKVVGNQTDLKSRLIASIERISDKEAVNVAINFVEGSNLSEEDKFELRGLIETKAQLFFVAESSNSNELDDEVPFL